MKQDEDLDRLEEEIRKLKNKYDQFFTGITKVPPMHDRKQIEIMIYEIGKLKVRDNARRFRYNTILSRFNQFREMWGRKMREREEGPIDFKRRKAALEETSAPPPPPPPPTATSESRVTSGKSGSYVKMVPGANGEEIQQLYSQIEKEHLKLGKLPTVTLDQLKKMVEQQTEVVRERYHVNAVAFRVDVVDGKVKLKAKPLQETS
jgi:hypothetical protein